MKPTNKLNIFLVDDDKMFLSSLAYRIRDAFYGIQVRSFLTGEECLDNIYDSPDAIILDYMMPGMNGLATLLSIKEQIPQMPVILLSNNRDERAIQQFFKTGADNYIVKSPDHLEKLKISIGEIIKNGKSPNMRHGLHNDDMMFCDLGGES